MTSLHAQLALLGASSRGDLAAASARALRRTVGARAAYAAVGDKRGLAVTAIDGDTRLVAPVGTVITHGAELSTSKGAAHVVSGLAAAPDATSAVVVSIGTQGVVVALLDAAPTSAALEDAAAIGAIAMATLEHLRTHEEGRALNRRLEALLELQRTLASGILEDAFAQFAARLRSEVAFDLAWVGMIGSPISAHPGPDEVELIAVDSVIEGVPRVGTVLSLAAPPLAAVLRSAGARSAGPTFLHAREAVAFAPWARSAVVLPLAVHDALVGVAVLVSREAHLDRASLGADAAWLVAAVAEPLAMAVQNSGLVGRLRAAMRDWQATFDVMDAMVLVADSSGAVRRANWALARKIGATPSTLVGRPVASLFPTQTLPSVTAPRLTLVGPRGEPLRASAVAMPDGGSVIVIHEVRAGATSASATMPALRRVSTGSGVTRGRVLIVDDEPSILRAVSRTVGRTHEVVTATDGDEALDLIRRDPLGFDAVMTDVQMPRMTGVDLYRAIEREIPALAERVLFMTGGVFAAEVESFLRGLKERVLRKPFDPDQLRRVVDERVALSRVA